MKRPYEQYVLIILAVVALALCGRYFLSHQFHESKMEPAATHSIFHSAVPTPRTNPKPMPTSYVISVTVLGEVKNPGAVLMAPGCTVEDCILRAGGIVADGDTSGMDLNRELYKDTLIYVPSRGEKRK